MSVRDGTAVSLTEPFGSTEPTTVVPLSGQQARAWELHQLDGDGRQNIVAALHLVGPLDLASLLRGLDTLALRHDLLRATFPVVAARPHQVVRGSAPQELVMIDLRGYADGARASEANQRTAAAAIRAFDLANGPAWRTIVVRLGDHEHQLAMCAHPVVADGRALRLLLRELCESVIASRRAHDMPVQFAASATFAKTVREDETRVRALSYWHERLAGVSSLELPFDSAPSGELARRSARHPLAFPDSLCEQLTALSQRQGVALDVTMLALFELLLHRYTGQTDITVGTRCVRSEAGEAHLVGPLSSTLALRADFSGTPTGLDCLRRVEAVSRAARLNHLPYEDLVESLGLPPVPQALFAWDDRPALALPAGVAVDWIEIDLASSRVSLSLELFRDRGRLSGHLEYDCERFAATTIARMADHLKRLAHGLVEEPNRPVALISIVSPAERDTILALSRGPVDVMVPELPVHALFEAQVDRTPRATALVWHAGSWTYDELDRRANQLAHHLVALGVGSETPVCVYMDRSPDMLVAMLGILKAGGTYVPMDPGYPRERLAHVLRETTTPLLITQSVLVPSGSAERVRALCLDTEWSAIANEPTERLDASVSPSQLAYVIFTSGSTGKPKGVMIEHRALVHYTTAATLAYGISKRDRIAQFSSISFDASIEEMFPTLTSGATLLLRRSSTLDPAPQFLAQCAEREITVLSLPTAYWHEVVAALARGEATIPPSLRLMIIGGERANADAWAAWHLHAPSHVRLLNTYGPSEATVVTTVWDAASGTAELTSVPIGRPLPHTAAYVLDVHQQLVPLGVPGELYIGGAAVGRGYINAPALTAERFARDPFSSRGRWYRTGDRCRRLPNGDLEFLGRADDQLKLSGHRIELGEIEARLREHPDVQDAAVVVRNDGGQLRLQGHVVARPGAAPSANELRSHLLRWLVPHLIPSLTLIDELPLTVNGKVDRAALLVRGATTTGAAIDGSRGPIEELLHQLFCELLPGKTVNRRDDFFALGGDSLSAVELVSLLDARLDVDMPAHVVFENPTIESLAQAIVAHIHGETARLAITVDALMSEARLDPSIRPASPYVPSQAPPQAIFVTGATGFFGAFVACELLAKTSARIHCLVRATSESDARTRLVAAWSHYFPARAIPLDRVVPVAGDLAQPRFGLSDASFRELARSVDVIYHAGATVHSFRPYHTLRASNVLGTEEVLRLAAAEKTKPVHHVSSLGVFGQTDHRVNEGSPLDVHTVDDGYSQSKWVAEQLVARAREVGIPVTIYRPGRLTGHSHDGTSNAKDLLDNVIQACVRLGAAPDLDLLVDMVPVDFASAALVRLSSRADSLGKVFHLGHPQPIHWRDLVAALTSFGYPLRVLPHEAWTAAVRHYATHRQEGRAALSVGGLSLSELSESLAAQYDCQATLAALAPTGLSPPSISSSLLRAGFVYLVKAGLLHAPHESR